MSDYGDTDDSAASVGSDVSLQSSTFWEEKDAEKESAATRRAKKERLAMGMWYYTLNKKRQQEENERIARKLASIEADFREVENFQITYAPVEYRTRGSSLSPRTPPRKVSSPQASIPPSPQPSTSKAGPPERRRRTLPQRQVMFRLADGSVVSSSDDEEVRPSRRSRQRIVSSSDDDDAASPPSVLKSGIARSSSGTDDRGAGEIGRVSQLSRERGTSGASLHGVLKENVDAEGAGSDLESASSSLTKADVIRKRRERIEKRQTLIEEICSGQRVSSTESTPKRPFLRTSFTTPKSRRISGFYSRVSKKLWPRTTRATPSPNSETDNEDPLAGLVKRQSRPSFCLSSAGSSFADAPAKSGTKSSAVWHSTPRRAQRGFFSLLGTRAACALASSSTFMRRAASADMPQRAHLRNVLDRGEVLVLVKAPEQGSTAAGSSFRGARPPVYAASAVSSRMSHATASNSRTLLSSRRHDDSSLSQSGVEAANRSTVIRIGMGDNRERILSSDAFSASSVIASLCGKSRSVTLQAAKGGHTDQAEKAPAAQADADDVDLMEELLEICQQKDPMKFDDALRLSQECEKCHKLGEGCTADVYLVRRPSGEESAVKIIPVGTERNLNGELPMSLANIIAEVVMTRELSSLRSGKVNQSSNFIELKAVYCVQDIYHPVLLDSWRAYDFEWCSENCNPKDFLRTQFYVLLEFENGGKALDRFKGSIEQMESAFLQVACSLAAAEPELEFEHRDLHCDNILVKPTDEKSVEFTLNGKKVCVRTAGIKAFIIDYTLSRLRKGGNVIYTDLSSDTALFKGTGSYQYDVYRIMKDENGGDWEAYNPHTNVLWLGFVLKKLLYKLPTTKQVHKTMATSRGRLATWKKTIPSQPSAKEFVAQHVVPHLERGVEAQRKAKRAVRPRAKKPPARNLRPRH